MSTLPPVTITAKSKGGLLTRIGWRESDCFKVNTSPDDLRRLNITRESSTTEPPQPFPTILELAQLSQHVYTISDFNDETEVPFKIEHLPDWICIGTGRYSDGYCGAAYVNYKHSHVVISHGGTEFKITKPVELYRDVIITDLGGVFLNKEVSQISSAYIFTKIIVNLCSDTQFSISVTGHSLGGWLAQISAFYIEHPAYISQNEKVKEIIEGKQRNLEIPQQHVEINKPYHLHTVSFDSPGCRRALKKIIGHYGSKMVEWRENVETLDFTVIIAPSNSVNTCGEHVGYVLTLEMPGVKEVSWVSSHAIKSFVSNLSSPEPKLKEVHDVYYRKPVEYKVESVVLYQWYIGRMDSCQVNIFSPKELTFLTHTQFILQWRNSMSFETSDTQIFKDVKHKVAQDILNSIESQFLNDFIQNFIVKHNVIEFQNNVDISKIVLKLITWFRLEDTKVWLNGSELQGVIQDLPECRQMMCESEGSLYVKRLPKLKDGHCTTVNLCARVRTFLENELANVLRITAGRDGRQSRLHVVHIFNCFKDYYKVTGEHVLFINISILRRLKSEIKMENIFSQTKLELIVVECDSEINEEMNGVITGMIRNAESEIKKLIIISCESCSTVANYRPLECDVDLTLQFEDLDESSKKVISQCHVEMHGYTCTLGKSDQDRGQYLLEDIDIGNFFKSDSAEIICDIFGGEIIDLSGRSLPVMAEHYIPRTLFQNTLDVGKLVNAKRLGEKFEFTDLLVVSNYDSSVQVLFPELSPLFGKGLIQEIDGEYTKESFLTDCEVNEKFRSRNVHWFMVEGVKEGSMLVWQMSKGQPCFDYLKNEEGGIPDSDMHELKNNFIILADEPGMGKSAAITKLFLEYRNTHYNSRGSHFNWPVYINLNAHQVLLRNKTYSYDSAFQFLIEAINLDGRYEKSLFKFCLENIGNLTFFIDSFDEISQKGQDFVVLMLEELNGMNHSRLRVWIATRNYAKYELEKKLGTKSYQFHRIKEKAQRKFLVIYWTHNVHLEQNDKNNLIEKFAEIFADRAIGEIREVIGADHTFIGIPLQLVLLAVIYNDSFLQSVESKLSYGGEEKILGLSDNDWKNSLDKFSSTLELYDLFVAKKMNIWLDDKFQFQTRTDWMDDTMKSRMNKFHSQAAYLYVSSSILANTEINILPLSPSDSLEVNRVGFCEISYDSQWNFHFYHQTIAEYFTAKYLVNLIRKNHRNNIVPFLKTHYHQTYFKKIRYFLDSLLCRDIPHLRNLEVLDTKGDRVKDQSLRERLTNGVWDSVDALGRNILHYAMAYGAHDEGIFWMIAKDLSLFHRKDLLGETCLSYSCLSENFMKFVFSCVRGHLDYRMIGSGISKIKNRDLIAQILRLPVLYSIFCGRRFQIWLDECIDSDSTTALVTGTEICESSKYNSQPPEEVTQYLQFLDLIEHGNRSLLTQNVEINMTWLTHCTLNGVRRIGHYLSRLCLHNSLDKNPEIFLSGWFNDCLSDDGDETSYKLGAKLIHACLESGKCKEYALTILRNNLTKYYHYAFPYINESEEIDLWNCCSDIKDKLKMLLVMKNYNFYAPLLREKQYTSDRFYKEVIDFIDRDSNRGFRDALKKNMAKAFQVSICAGYANIAYRIFHKSGKQAKAQMLWDNFELREISTIHDELLIVHDEQTFKDIIDGNDELWTLRSLEKIRDENIQSQFFTLPVLADYTFLGDNNLHHGYFQQV